MFMEQVLLSFIWVGKTSIRDRIKLESGFYKKYAILAGHELRLIYCLII